MLVRSVKSSVFVILLLITMIAFSGCGTSNKNASQISDKNTDHKDWPNKITVAAGPPDAVIGIVGTALANIINDNLLPATPTSAGGGSSNLVAVSKGEAEIGLTPLDQVVNGYKGEQWAKGKKYDNVRLLAAPVYINYLHAYTLRETGIEKFSDFNGKVISPGNPGGSMGVYAEEMFNALGIKPARMPMGSFSDISDQMVDGMVDATIIIGSVPWTSVEQLSASKNVVILGPDENERKIIQEKYPFFIPSAIHASKYKKLLDKDMPTFAIPMTIHANVNIPEDLAYQITKIIYENNDRFVKSHPSTSDLVLENAAKYIKFPLHKGAAKYYQEKGIAISDEAKPID
jgi:TRAP transporter TAXI family solute receptor